MTKQELMENYTKEGLADEYVAMQQFYEVEKYKLKYMKELEEQNKKCKFEIAEYQKKIEELEKKSDFYFPEEPIKIADLMIYGWETIWDYKHLSKSELRQIAEHLLVYCNHNGEAEAWVYQQ